MAARRRLWAPLLVTLLVAMLLGMFGGGEQVAAVSEPRATVGKIMIPAAAFTPTEDDWNYINFGYKLEAFGGVRVFHAPVWFPAPEVKVRKIILVAYDNTAETVCLSLVRAQPLAASRTVLGSACTVNSSSDPQKAATTAISPRIVDTIRQGLYLRVEMGPNTRLYGVQVTYTY